MRPGATPSFAWLVLCLAGCVLGLAACAEAPSENGVARGTFVMYLDGAVQDTIRGAAYLRDTTAAEPGLELDADSVGWSAHWMRSDTPTRTYALMPHALLQDAQSAATEGVYQPPPRVDDPPAASLFMEYKQRGTFEAQAGTLHVDRATATEHVGRMQATLTLRGRAAPRITVTGRWHAVPAPQGAVSALRPGRYGLE